MCNIGMAERAKLKKKLGTATCSFFRNQGAPAAGQQLALSSQTPGQQPWGTTLLGFSPGGFLMDKVEGVGLPLCLTSSMGSLDSLRRAGFRPKNGVFYHIPAKGNLGQPILWALK